MTLLFATISFMKEFITLPELAAMLGVSARTISRAIEEGMPFHRVVAGGQRLFVLDEVREHMRELGNPDKPARRKRKRKPSSKTTETLRAQGFEV